jgi:hypothetical protein
MIGKPMTRMLLIAVFYATWSCAGDGTGLDEFGNPLATGPDTIVLGPTLSAMQKFVFDPICTQCHTGAAAPLGLALDSGVARGNMVSVASVEIPAMFRVNPGNPDSSYVVWKIEGRAGIIGGQMPLGMQPLSADVITAFRGWIADGAEAN